MLGVVRAMCVGLCGLQLAALLGVMYGFMGEATLSNSVPTGACVSSAEGDKCSVIKPRCLQACCKSV